jgi:hypothetical protein
MSVRFKEHHNRMKMPDFDDHASPIGQHARTSGHHFRPGDISYLAKESNKITRGIKEAIFARALDPLLNRGGGLRPTSMTPFFPPPKPPPPSVLDSPSSAPGIIEPRSRGRPLGARSRLQCLPLIDAAIAAAAAPTGAPPANQPATQPKRYPGRPPKKPAITQPARGSPGTLAPLAPPTAQPDPPVHTMSTRSRTLRSNTRPPSHTPPLPGAGLSSLYHISSLPPSSNVVN